LKGSGLAGVSGGGVMGVVRSGEMAKKMGKVELQENQNFVLVPESFHEQTDEELTENDIKWMDADDQAIQTILLGLPEDVYAAVDKNIAANLKFLNNLQPAWKSHVTIVCQTKNLHEADFTQIYDFLKINQDEDRQTQNVGGNGGNQFGQYAGQVAQNQQGYNAWQNGITNQNGTGNVVAARAEEEFDFMAAAGDLDKIEEVNTNCILIEILQHVSTSGSQLDKAPVYDTDGSVKVQLNNNCYDNKIFSMFTQGDQYTDLLEPIPEPQLVPYNDNHVTSIAPNMVQSGGVFVPETTKSKEWLFLSNVSNMVTVSKTISIPNEDLSDDTTPSAARKFLNEYTTCEECKYEKISYDKAYNDMQKKVERLQAQLRDLKGKSSDTPSASNTLDPLNQKLESKIVELEFQVVNYERTSNRAHAKLHNLIYENAQLRAWVFENTSESMNNTSRTSVTPHVDKPKLSVVTPHSKKFYASIQSHTVPHPREFNVVKHRNVIVPGMFKINPSQTSKENVSSDMVTASSIGLVHTARTRRPQPKGNTRNARAPSASKSSELKKNVTIGDHRRTLLLSKNQKTMSSNYNNIKLAI
nr:Gag-Pol polyprotein [Tanacetum cinerariifolium]